MRQIFSVRFFAAVGGVVALFFLLTTIFATREVIEGGDDGPAAVELHKIDFVEQIAATTNPDFALTVDGVAADDTNLIIDESRSVLIVADTPGENHCPQFPARDGCALVADLLGEAVVWFALVPSGPNRTVDLPAIDTLDDGIATLVNGWQVPFAPVLDRRCGDEEFTSYREFRELLGDEFISVFGIDDRRLTAVECRVRVDYAPEVDEATDEAPADARLPAPPFDPPTRTAMEDAIIATLEGIALDEAVERLETAGWTVRTADLDADVGQTADLEPDRVTVQHRDSVVVAIELG